MSEPEMLTQMYAAEMGIVRFGLALHVAAIAAKPDGVVSMAIAMAALESERAPTDMTARACAYIAELRLINRDYCGDAREVCRFIFLAPESDC